MSRMSLTAESLGWLTTAGLIAHLISTAFVRIARILLHFLCGSLKYITRPLAYSNTRHWIAQEAQVLSSKLHVKREISMTFRRGLPTLYEWSGWNEKQRPIHYEPSVREKLRHKIFRNRSTHDLLHSDNFIGTAGWLASRWVVFRRISLDLICAFSQHSRN